MAMLATSRLGALHSVVFAGFAPSALAERVEDAASKVGFGENILGIEPSESKQRT